MVQYKDIHKEVTSIGNYFIIALILAFICLVSYLISIMIEIPIKYTSFVIATLMTSFFLYRGATPLFIQYKDYIYRLSEIARKALAEMKKEEAEKLNVLADLQELETIYEKEKSNSKQLVKELSELQNENSELKASDNRELANLKQQIANFKAVQEELRQKTIQLSRLQIAEKYLFLAELDLTPQQVKKGLANTFNGLMNGKTESEKERIRQIINTQTIHV